jgi:hypothetical protein
MPRNRPAPQGLPTRQGAEKERNDYGKEYVVVQMESAGKSQPGKLFHRGRRKTTPAPPLAWDIRRTAAAGGTEVTPAHYCEIPPFDEHEDDGKPSS